MKNQVNIWIKSISAIILVVSILAGYDFAFAGLTVYEKGDLKVGVSDVSAGTFYNFGEKELLAGSTSSIVEWKTFNFDVGALGDVTFISPVCGISTDEPGKLLQNLVDVVTDGRLKIEDKIKTGIYGGRDFSRSIWLYGIYMGVAIKF